MATARRRAIVIGAGLGGLAATLGLSRAGFAVSLFDKAKELTPAGFGIGITTNGLQALDHLGAYQAVAQTGCVAEESHVKTRSGLLVKTINLREMGERVGFPSRIFHRADLQRALQSLVPAECLSLGARCVAIEQRGSEVVARFDDGREAVGEVLIGADGVGSVVREALHGKDAQDPARFASYVTWLATTELSHPMLTPGYNAHYWGTGARFGIHNTGGDQWYIWGTKNKTLVPEQLRELHMIRCDQDPLGKSELFATFRRWAPEIPYVIRATPASRFYLVNTRDRDPLAFWGRGRVTLLGDAAHPMLTSLGQGAAMAFEDAVVLARCLEAEPNVPEALLLYERLRVPRTTSVVEATRRMSAYEQAGNPITARLRNASFFHLPDSLFEKQIDEMTTFTPPELEPRVAKSARARQTPDKGELVLVSGASSGIGRAIALSLAEAGYDVLAGVRSADAYAELEALQLPGLTPVRLDVADTASIDAAVEAVHRRGLPLRALINNAATCEVSPLELQSPSALQDHFTVNVVGTSALTQAALPLLLEARGRVLNIGSSVGWTRPPFLGAYAASKVALEALTDVWRRELHGTGVAVSLVVPGPVHTPVWDKMADSADQALARASAEVRARHAARLRKFVRMNHASAAKSALSAEDVAKAVLASLSHPKPKRRYELGRGTTTAGLVGRTLPSAWVDTAFQTALGVKTDRPTLGAT